jgi:hypothetical protein
MNRCKPIVVLKNGKYIDTVANIGEAAKLAGVGRSWACRVYQLGIETSQGFAFDDPAIPFVEFRPELVWRADNIISKGVHIEYHIGTHFWMANRIQRLQFAVENQQLRYVHVLSSFDVEHGVFVDTEGGKYRFAYKCPYTL